MINALFDDRGAEVVYDDLGQWIVESENLGEPMRATWHSWETEIGMAAELLQHDPKVPRPSGN